MIKGAILGLGFIGKVHYDAFKSSEKVQLTACFDTNEKNLGTADGVRKYTNLEDFFAEEKDKIDFVDICLPTFMHREITVKALERGFHVLCEKPMALTTEDCNAMTDAATKYNKKLMIAHVLRFDEEFTILNHYIKDKLLGKVKNVKYTTYRTGLPDGEANWFKNKELSGGTIFDVHIHDTDLLLWYFGMPNKITTVANSDTRQLGIESFSTNMHYNDDFFVNIQCDMALAHSGHYQDRSLRVNFEKGYILKDQYRFIAVNEKGEIKDLKTNCNENLMYQTEIEYFAKEIETNGNMELCHPKDSTNAIRLVLSEIKSAESDGEIIYF